MISSHFVMGLTLAGRTQKVQQIQLSRIFERTTLVECEVLHRETTAESHDKLLGFRGDRLETIIPIEARGEW